MQVWENPEKCCLSAYTVSIFGDLRDVDTGDWIIEWFKEKLSDEALYGKNFLVRQAVITVEEEFGHAVKTWTWTDKEN